MASDTKEITGKATQDFVPIKEVRDGILVLKDNSMRGILITSSVNFALKSPDEQQSIIYQFQSFLNSLNFTVQIFIQSRKLDIRPYIAMLEKQEKEQTNDLMKIQTKEYMEFIKSFTESVNIMTKSFFIVVPYAPPVLNVQKGSSFNPFAKKTEQSKKENFEEARTQLEQRLGVVEQGIVRCGVRAVQLGTEEAVEAFYKLFNPGAVEKPIKTAEQQ